MSKRPNIDFDIDKTFQIILHYYHFRSWPHHIQQRNRKCDRLLCQCNSHRFDKELRRIRQYLQKIVKVIKICSLFSINKTYRCRNLYVDVHHEFQMIFIITSFTVGSKISIDAIASVTVYLISAASTV